MKKLSRSLILSIPFALAACGGGGDEAASTASAQVAVTTLSGSNGDMSKYLGTWRSDCGLIFFGTNQGKSQMNVFQFTAVNGNAVTGTLTISVYDESNCKVTVSQPQVSTVQVTATYQGNLSVTSSTPATRDGTADQLALGVTGAGTTQSFTVGFYENFTRFFQGTSSYFSIASLSYRKS